MFKLRIGTNNVAFENGQFSGRTQEIVRILKEVIRKLESGDDNNRTILLDINGNKVGEYTLTKR